ncbi:MAG: SAM-dependent methyltransferase [Geodermatophilaceae bacterium]
MTRGRKPTGRIIFVGAGPGDPGLVTARAGAVLAAADLVVADPEIGAGVLDLAGDVEVRPAVGEPPEVAKVLVAEARTGRSVARLVAGDPFTCDAVVKEALAVARTSVPFDVVPGVPVATAVPCVCRHRRGFGVHRGRHPDQRRPGSARRHTGDVDPDGPRGPACRHLCRLGEERSGR